MTIEEKLNSIRQTKEDIKTSLRNKGIEISDTDPFSNYPIKIDGIGSGEMNVEEYFDTEHRISSGSNQGGDWANCVQKLPALKCTTGTSLNYAFYKYNGTTLDLSLFDTSNVVNLAYVFNNCSNLLELNLSSFNTEKVTTMSNLFNNCKKLQKINISSFNTQNTNTMASMFSNCRELKEIDVSKFNTEKVTSFVNMFYYCMLLTELNLSSFKTPLVTTMGSMFYYCNALESLDLSTFATPKLTNVSSMFYMCRNLKHIDMRNFDFTNVTSYSLMFGNSAGDSIPNSCEIIVKDETAKTWLTSKFTRLTNVKTVEEYELEQASGE